MFLIEVERQGQRKRFVSLISHEFGDVPTSAIVGEIGGHEKIPSPANFVPNEEFVRYLHQCIAGYGPQAPGLIAEASRQKDGVIYVIDARTKSPKGRVPAVDIIGAFKVSHSRVDPSSYQKNPNHRLITEDGFFQLDSFLENKLKELLTGG